MKKKLTLLFLLTSLNCTLFAQDTIRVFNKVLFYDGYADTTILPKPGPPNVIRFSTSQYSTKLTASTLSNIGAELTMKISVKAACDNYDRIGNVYLAFTPKGATTYDPATTRRLEIARFITPFMNKNIKLDSVPFVFNINNVASILNDTKLTDTSDIWLELSIFGVPYAANTQIAGCAGRSDVFYGTVDFITGGTSVNKNDNILKILSNYKSFNNYNATATDTIGKTTKTISFSLDSISYNTQLVLIISNHGANSGGEEYNRRLHNVYFDGVKKNQFKPGYLTCEPYRKYNTQSNGIYGASSMTPAQWQSFSNWCPGAIIPIREIDLGTLQPGVHTFKIDVPSAKFANKEGDFPLTAYVQGKRSPQLVSVKELEVLKANTFLYPNPSKDNLTIESETPIKNVRIFSILGQEVLKSFQSALNISELNPGFYTIIITFENNLSIVKPFVKN